jgi:hypothetical protein
MTASLNAAASSSHLASVRDAREVKAGNSSANGESFSQVLRRTSGDQKPSGSYRKGEVEKGESKSTKKDDDANTTAPVDASGNAAVVEKSALPITFLFGVPAEQHFESFDSKTGSHSVLSGGMANGNSDPVLLMTPTSSFTAADNVHAQEADASAPTTNDAQLSIGSSGNNSRGAAGALSANTLAFAMRLGSGESLNASKTPISAPPASPAGSQSTPANAGSAMATMIQAASASTLEENAHQHDPSAQDQHIVEVSAAPVPERFDPTKVTEDHPAAAQAPADPPAGRTAEPVRNVHMQLVSDDNRRVDVRLIDRGGELHVSVKSADPALTQNLQDHLPDLTARLDKQHMQSEVWVPKAAEPAKADRGSTNGSLSDSNGRSYSGNSEGRKDGRQQGKPDWVDALESYT